MKKRLLTFVFALTTTFCCKTIFAKEQAILWGENQSGVGSFQVVFEKQENNDLKIGILVVKESPLTAQAVENSKIYLVGAKKKMMLGVDKREHFKQANIDEESDLFEIIGKTNSEKEVCWLIGLPEKYYEPLKTDYKMSLTLESSYGKTIKLWFSGGAYDKILEVIRAPVPQKKPQLVTKSVDVKHVQKICKELITERLKAPSTASFISSNAEQYSLEKYKAIFLVDSQNGFGAMIRNQFTCYLKYRGGAPDNASSWSLLNIKTAK